MSEHLSPPSADLPDTKGVISAETTGRFAVFIAKLGEWFSLLFLLSMATLLFEVIMRYVFASPTIWAHETTTFLCAISFVFGGLYSVSKNSHIRIVLLYEHVSDRVRRYLNIAIYTVCGMATATFAVATWPTVVKSLFNPAGDFRMITSGSAWNPPFPAILRSFLFLVLVVMTIQFALFMLHHIRRRTD